MEYLLGLGETLHTEGSKLPCVIRSFIGSGGQGEVYEATLAGSGVAVKWYHPAAATAEQRRALQALVVRGRPGRAFLWPTDLLLSPRSRGFGYVMPLLPAGFCGMAALMRREVEPSLRTLATAGLALADSFLALHAEGLCYRDISFGNVFIDPATGDILIADNDNVGVDGEAAGVLGTPRFMAPEVVRGERLPSSQTDLFSLAVLLFYMFVLHHPFEGARESMFVTLDLIAMVVIYGQQPVFVFDPDDDSNRPVPGLHDNALALWPIYPKFLRDRFVQSFTVGVRDPVDGRVRESEWRETMATLRDHLVYCLHCGVELFADPLGEPARPVCWRCGRPVPLPPHLKLGPARIVMLNHDTRLFAHHLDDSHPYDFATALAEVTRHPAEPGVWGLHNTSALTWTAVTPSGVTHQVPPGRTVRLTSGTRIAFGTRTTGIVMPGG